MAEVAHFIKDAAKGPHITLVAVWLVLKELWGHVVGSSDASVCEVLRAIQHLCDAKVAQTDLSYVRWVEHLPFRS